VLKKYKNITVSRIIDVNKNDVAKFYTWSESHFGSNKSFNKCMGALKAFFKFLIEIEDVIMKNPFSGYTHKSIKRKNVETLTKSEFEAIMGAVGTTDSFIVLGGKGSKKNLYKPYLTLGFKLFLLTGLRREELINVKWCNITTSINGVKFFSLGNQKVNLQKNTDTYVKYVAVNEDLMDLLNELGYSQKRNTNEYIFYPNRNVSSKTIMDNLSKAFTHYRKNAGITKPISLSNLRKTYITWLNRVIGNQTGVLTSHAGEQVLKDHYIDTRVLTTIEEAALKVKIFG
jgi:integrase